MKKLLFLAFLATSAVFLNAADPNQVIQQERRTVQVDDLQQIIQGAESRMTKNLIPLCVGTICALSGGCPEMLPAAGCPVWSSTAATASGISIMTMSGIYGLQLRYLINSLNGLIVQPIILQAPAPQQPMVNPFLQARAPQSSEML